MKHRKQANKLLNEILASGVDPEVMKAFKQGKYESLKHIILRRLELTSPDLNIRNSVDEQHAVNVLKEFKEGIDDEQLEKVFSFIYEKAQALQEEKANNKKPKVVHQRDPYANLPADVRSSYLRRDKLIKQFEEGVANRILTPKTLEVLTADANKNCECEVRVKTHYQTMEDVNMIFDKADQFFLRTENLRMFTQSAYKKFLELQKQGNTRTLDSIKSELTEFVKDQEQYLLKGKWQQAVDATLKMQRDLEVLLPEMSKTLANDAENTKKTKVLAEELTSFRAKPENKVHYTVAKKIFGYDSSEVLIDFAGMQSNTQDNSNELTRYNIKFKKERESFQNSKIDYRDMQKSIENYFSSARKY